MKSATAFSAGAALSTRPLRLTVEPYAGTFVSNNCAGKACAWGLFAPQTRQNNTTQTERNEPATHMESIYPAETQSRSGKAENHQLTGTVSRLPNLLW